MNFMINSLSKRLKSNNPMFRTIAEKRTLLEHFPLNKTLPLVVVISPDGKIDAITTSEMLTEDYVGALIKGESRYAPLKRNGIEQVPQLLSFTINDVKQYKPIYYTSLSGEIDGTDAVKDTQVDTLKRTEIGRAHV